MIHDVEPNPIGAMSMTITDEQIRTKRHRHVMTIGDLSIVVDARPAHGAGGVNHLQLRMETQAIDWSDDDYQSAWINFTTREHVQELIDTLQSARDMTFGSLTDSDLAARVDSLGKVNKIFAKSLDRHDAELAELREWMDTVASCGDNHVARIRVLEGLDDAEGSPSPFARQLAVLQDRMDKWDSDHSYHVMVPLDEYDRLTDPFASHDDAAQEEVKWESVAHAAHTKWSGKNVWDSIYPQNQQGWVNTSKVAVAKAIELGLVTAPEGEAAMRRRVLSELKAEAEEITVPKFRWHTVGWLDTFLIEMDHPEPTADAEGEVTHG